VARYLLVANQTLGGDQLIDEVRRRIAAGPSSFYVLVPNTHPPDPSELVRPSAALLSSTEDEHRATLIAQSRLRTAIDQLRAQGVEAQGDLGDPDPLTAIGEVLAEQQFDEIIISTLPSGISRWLGMDLPHQAQRKFKLPVTTVTAKG
jgi:GABA permease